MMTGFCFQCGAMMFVDNNGISHHGDIDCVDYNADADHVPYLDQDQELN